MNNNKWKMIVFLLAAGLLGLGTTYYSSASQTSTVQSQTGPAVTNKTTAIEVISILPARPQGLELVMRNASDKNINGYSVGFNNRGSVTSDRTSTSKPIIAPGEQFKLRLPVTATVIILYVVFDDNSIDGDAELAAQLQDRRLGIQRQLQNIVNLLSSEGTTADVEQLQAKIKELPDQAPGSDYVVAGMRNAKEDALMALQRLDKHSKSVGLSKLLEESKRRVTLLRARP
jgi:hypothetical protein